MNYRIDTGQNHTNADVGTSVFKRFFRVAYVLFMILQLTQNVRTTVIMLVCALC